MQRQKRDSSLVKRVGLVALGILAVFTIVATYLRLSPPSHWFSWCPDATAEWLGWIGAAGLAFAIWQLVITADAATRSRDAVEHAMGRLNTFDVSTDLSVVEICIQQAQELLASGNLPNARTSCHHALTALGRIRRQNSKLPSERRDEVNFICNQVGSAHSALLRGNLEEAAVISLLETFRSISAAVADCLGALRESGAGQ